MIDNKVQYSCSEEELEKYLKEEWENAEPYFDLLNKNEGLLY